MQGARSEHMGLDHTYLPVTVLHWSKQCHSIGRCEANAPCSYVIPRADDKCNLLLKRVIQSAEHLSYELFLDVIIIIHT